MFWTTRTPLRVSLFGGGTDYPEYFSRRPGAVVGLAINKYIHISALRLNAFQEYNYRVAYSKLEFASCVSDIEHPVVREVLKMYKINDRLDISVLSDLPASGSGLGSSSAFTVGFVNTMLNLQNRPTTKIDIAKSAIHVERELLRENVGVQDQLHAAFGGVNRFDFSSGRTQVTPVQLPGKAVELLNASMVLVHTGIARRATTTVAEQLQHTRDGKIDNDLTHLYDLVDVCVGILEDSPDNMLTELGRMLSESWEVKRRLSSGVSRQDIDELYQQIMVNGAYGAKLCGAGGGGFFLALVPPDTKERLCAVVAPRAVIPIAIDVHGTTLIYPASGPCV